MLVKLGLAAEWENWSAGLTITTPSLAILGDGSVYQNKSYSGDFDPDNPGADDPYLQPNHQEDLDPHWKSPVSIAGGGAVILGSTRFHFTAEWFNNIGHYQVLDPEPYQVQSQPDQTEQFVIEYAAKNVINYGFGVDHPFTDTFSLFTSYRIDHSIMPDDLDKNISMGIWDLNHITGGASFGFFNLEFTAGLQYSWGSGLADRFLSFNDSEDGGVLGQYQDMEITYHRLKVLLGFNLPFSVPEEND